MCRGRIDASEEKTIYSLGKVTYGGEHRKRGGKWGKRRVEMLTEATAKILEYSMKKLSLRRPTG